jgi:lipoic acid synthetase
LGLKYTVLTSFTRDDLLDSGAAHIARTVDAIHEVNPNTTVEVIVHTCPTCDKDVETILASSPEIITHCVMTVPRLNQELFEKTDYAISLEFIEKVKSLSPSIVTKSGLLLGLGENDYEVIKVIADLHDYGCNCITLEQYLPPSSRHHQPSRSVSLQEFFEYQYLSMQMGYSSVRSGPFICSSFHAMDMYKEIAE